MELTRTEIRELCKKHTEEAINTVVAILKSPKSPQKNKLAAAEIILDRGWGKPTQNVESDSLANAVRTFLIRPDDKK